VAIPAPQWPAPEMALYAELPRRANIAVVYWILWVSGDVAGLKWSKQLAKAT